jgi:hypothetical protein
LVTASARLGGRGVVIRRFASISAGTLNSLFSLGLQQRVVAQFFLAKTGLAFQYKM